jgi:RNA recognition motif-containing protein
MIFEGTKFEKLESSIRDEINRKRRRGTSTAPHDSYDATEKKRTKQNRDGKVNGSNNTPKHRVEETSSLVKKNVTKISNISKQDATKTSDSGPASNDEFSNDRTVYVQGLPFTSTEEDISLFFKDVGQIISIRLPKWHDSGG